MDTTSKIVDSILRNICYMNIATVSEDWVPWNTPVFFAWDEEYHFYWASPPSAHHSKNIENNPQVFLTVFDSTAKPGIGTAVYVQAKAEIVENEERLKEIVSLLYKRQGKPARKPSEFLGNYPRRIYQATPQKVWVNKDTYIQGHRIDVRVPIKLRRSR